MPPRPIHRSLSTIAIGTAFEQHALAVLHARMSMSLRRVGGAYDGGVDLRGWWYLPRSAQPLGADGPSRAGEGGAVGGEEEMFWKNERGEEVRRILVLAQCKALSTPLAARPIRELEGVFSQLNHREPSAPSWPQPSAALDQLIYRGGRSADKGRGYRPRRRGGEGCGGAGGPEGVYKGCDAACDAIAGAAPTRQPPGGQPRRSSALSDSDDLSTASSGSEGDGQGVEEDLKIESAWWNRALSEDLLGGKMELRREVLLRKGAKTTTGLWMGGKRVGRCVPGSVDEEEDL